MTELRRFGRQVGVVFSGTLLGQLVLVSVAPIITRLYTPSDLGAFGVYVSVIGVLTACVSLRYEMALPLPLDEAEVDHLLVLCLGLVLSVSSVAGLVTAYVGAFWPSAVNDSALGGLTWLVAPGLFVAGGYQLLSMYAVRRQSFRVLSASRLAHGSTIGLVQVMAGLVNAVPLTLGLGHFAGQMAGSVGLARNAFFGARQICLPRPRELRALASRYRRFPLLLMPAHVLNTAGVHLVPVLLAAVHGQTVVGLYYLGQRAVGTPAALLARSLGDVFMGQGGEILRRDPNAFRQLFHSVLARLAGMALLPGLLLAFGAPSAFAWIFGEAWGDAGAYMQVLVPVLVLEVSVDPLVRFALLERQDLAAWWAAARLALVCGALVIAAALELEPVRTVGLLAAGQCLAYLLKWILWEGAMSRRIESWKHVAKGVSP